jgi:Fe(3+) dicitrate transport protein
MQKAIITAILALFLNYSFAGSSENELKGKVIHNETGVPYISVQVKGTTIGSVTNFEGEFSIENPPSGEIELLVNGMGYKTGEYQINNPGKNGAILLKLDKDEFYIDEVLVTGSQVGALRYLPGSVSFVQAKKIKASSPVSANELLRAVPGVHILDEEGAGLRINIGIRGLDPDKSRNVLVLEDGMPVALAPYGEPEMYYSPNIERMNGIEILKGNGSILFGPQTIGGVVNYITADPSADPSGFISFKTGTMGYNNAYARFSNTVNNIGFDVNYNRKQAENFGPTKFLLHDINSKLLLDFSPKSRLTLKMSIYDENSNSTYVGLTQAIYNEGGNDYLQIAPDDNLHIRRYALSALHRYEFNSKLSLRTSMFGYTTTRNWKRQDFTYNPNASGLTGIVHGNENLPDGAIYMRNSTGQRNRQFEVAGIEPRLSYNYFLLGMNSKIDAGTRFLFEKAYEQRVNGTKANAVSGNLHTDEIRTGYTFSTFIQNKTLLTQALTATVGLRTESIRYEREIFRTSGKDTLIGNTTNDFAIIPGAGLNYKLNENMGLFTGIHRGYAPPRTKDAISNSGADLELEAEKSWNYELGIRSDIGSAHVEVSAFYMNFENQVIPVSESSGGHGAGLINGGKTSHSGAEMYLYVPLNTRYSSKWDNSLNLSATYVNSIFSSDRYILHKTPTDSALEPEYINVKGNKTPYAPEFKANASLQIEYSGKIGMKVTGNYIGQQFTDALNTKNVEKWIEKNIADTDYNYKQATLNGRIGLLDAYFICDISAWYNTPIKGLSVSASVKNLLNERYIASRRPQGIKVGMPRFVSAGISYSF